MASRVRSAVYRLYIGATIATAKLWGQLVSM